VICLAPAFFVFIGLRAASDQFVSPGVAGKLARDIGLGNDGGNTVLLTDGPVLELGDLCYKNWTTAVVSFYFAGRRQCIRTRSMHVMMWVDLGVTCYCHCCCVVLSMLMCCCHSLSSIRYCVILYVHKCIIVCTAVSSRSPIFNRIESTDSRCRYRQCVQSACHTLSDLWW